jgi:hypothetical protein
LRLIDRAKWHSFDDV